VDKFTYGQMGLFKKVGFNISNLLVE